MENETIKIWILTIFPEMFGPFLNDGIASKGLSGDRGRKLEVNLVNLRDHCFDKYKSVDGYAFGGGPGMVMRADVLENALLEGVLKKGNYEDDLSRLQVIYTSPRGNKWTNSYCKDFVSRLLPDTNEKKDLVFICGRYEGIDERFIKQYVDEQICIGDFILTGGELAVMTILDSAIRFVPGVLGNKESAKSESFQNGLLDNSLYTKPRVFNGEDVPSVLLSGHHKKIAEFHENERIQLTKKYRPDLFESFH